MSLAVEPDDNETVLGKAVSDLQSGIIVNDKSIEGTLLYATGFTGFSGDPALQEGHFLALKFEAPVGATTTVEVLGGHAGPITLDADMEAVVRIENKKQKLRVVTTTTESEVLAKEFSLALLTFEPKED